MPIHTDDDFELEGDNFYLCHASADFDYSLEYVNGDDFTGWDIARLELYRIRLGGVNLTRSQAVDATSEPTIAQAEQFAAKTIIEQVKSGDLLAAE